MVFGSVIAGTSCLLLLSSICILKCKQRSRQTVEAAKPSCGWQHVKSGEAKDGGGTSYKYQSPGCYCCFFCFFVLFVDPLFFELVIPKTQHETTSTYFNPPEDMFLFWALVAQPLRSLPNLLKGKSTDSMISRQSQLSRPEGLGKLTKDGSWASQTTCFAPAGSRSFHILQQFQTISLGYIKYKFVIVCPISIQSPV